MSSVTSTFWCILQKSTFRNEEKWSNNEILHNVSSLTKLSGHIFFVSSYKLGDSWTGPQGHPIR